MLKQLAMAIDDKISGAKYWNPLLELKIRMEEVERERPGIRYELFYEKTYSGGSTDVYQSSVKAENDKEAVKYAQQKLLLKDALAVWSTDITDAYLIHPDGKKIMIPNFSRELR